MKISKNILDSREKRSKIHEILFHYFFFFYKINNQKWRGKLMSPAIEMTNDDVISISFDNVKISFFCFEK